MTIFITLLFICLFPFSLVVIKVHLRLLLNVLLKVMNKCEFKLTKYLRTKIFRLRNIFFLKINRLVPQENDTTRSLTLDSDTRSSIELSIRNLDRLAKTFHEICSGLTTQLLMLSGKSSISNQTKKN